MKQEILTDAISELDEDLIVDYFDTRIKLEHWKSWRKKMLHCAAVAAVLVVAVVGSMSLLRDTKSRGYLAPAHLTTKPVQRTGRPLTEEELAAFQPAAKEDAIYLLLNHSDDPTVAGLQAKDLHFSNGFHHVQAVESGNYLSQDHLQYLVLHGRKVLGRLLIFRSDDSGELVSQIEGAPCDDRLTELLRKYDGSELAMIYFGPFVEAALTPDGVLHYLNGDTDLPAQSDDYYELFFTGDNCITGID